MDTFYLIDFENVGHEGLEGCKSLSKSDHIVIFFTSNAKKVDMSMIADHGDAELDMQEVPAGKQSTDMRIASYLGYYAEKNKLQQCRVVVVSKDKDYDDVITHWKNEGLGVIRRQKIGVNAQQKTVKKQLVDSTKPQISKAKKAELKNRVKKIVGVSYAEEVANEVARISTEHYGQKHFLKEVKKELQEMYQNGDDVFKCAEPILSKFVNPVFEKMKK